VEFRTKINIGKSPAAITYSDPVLFIGSCFTSSIGMQMDTGRMPVMINPSGTVYNPVSVANTLKTITSKKVFTSSDLYNHNGTWLSFLHYTDFSSEDKEESLGKINRKLQEAADFISGARFLFVTFGTARVFRLKDTGEIVSNCHKLPSEMFSRELLSVDEISRIWVSQLDFLKENYPQLKVVFTVSPVRHWKDGAHGNQVSKSVLFLAIEELLRHSSSPDYFPAYEIMMDELRDYRFYADDMLHPSGMAVDYIWDAFSSRYMDDETLRIYREASKIIRASQHRITSLSGSKTREFAANILTKIVKLEKQVPGINFSREKKYFFDLC
jgi:hypothetical protein